MSNFEKIWRHFKTICRHKAFVFQECRACGITWQGIIHDLSKFGRIEFVSSARYFQGDRSPIEAEKEEGSIMSAGWSEKSSKPSFEKFSTDIKLMFDHTHKRRRQTTN